MFCHIFLKIVKLVKELFKDFEGLSKILNVNKFSDLWCSHFVLSLVYYICNICNEFSNI